MTCSVTARLSVGSPVRSSRERRMRYDSARAGSEPGSAPGCELGSAPGRANVTDHTYRAAGSSGQRRVEAEAGGAGGTRDGRSGTAGRAGGDAGREERNGREGGGGRGMGGAERPTGRGGGWGGGRGGGEGRGGGGGGGTLGRVWTGSVPGAAVCQPFTSKLSAGPGSVSERNPVESRMAIQAVCGSQDSTPPAACVSGPRPARARQHDMTSHAERSTHA